MPNSAPGALRPATAAPLVVKGARPCDEAAERIDRPGIAIGLAWTPAGRNVLFVEAVPLH